MLSVGCVAVCRLRVPAAGTWCPSPGSSTPAWLTRRSLSDSPSMSSRLKRTQAPRNSWATARSAPHPYLPLPYSLISIDLIKRSCDGCSKTSKPLTNNIVVLSVSNCLADAFHAIIYSSCQSRLQRRPTVSGRKDAREAGTSFRGCSLPWQVLSQMFPGVDHDLNSCLPLFWQVQKELGLAFHPIEETYADMAVTLIQKGILKPKHKAALVK